MSAWLPSNVSDASTVSTERQELKMRRCWTALHDLGTDSCSQYFMRRLLVKDPGAGVVPSAIVAASAGDVVWQVRDARKWKLYKSSSTLGLLGARGFTSGTPPACCQGPAADHPGTRTKKLVGLQPSGDGSHAIQSSPALQTRFRWSGGVMSCRLCPGWRVKRKPAGQLKVFSNHQGFPHGILDRRCARNRVFRNRLAHLMQFPGPSDGAALRIG